MQVIDESLIAEAGRRLAAAAPGARVISHARGGADPRSDVDFVPGSLVHAALSQGRFLAG
jgi:hypothetical protein